MKKSICLILSVLLAFSLCIAVGADPVATLTKDLSVFAGEQVAITLSFEGVGSVTSASVQVTCTEGISFVSAEFLKKGTLSKFDNETGKGAIATSDINGDLLSIVVEGVTVSQKETVTVVVKAKNSQEDVLNITATTTVKVLCEEHTYGNFKKYDKDGHARLCTVCGYAKTYEHTWDKGLKVQDPTCTIPGSFTYTCTVCGEKKGEIIPVLENHHYVTWQIEVAPTCYAEGVEYSNCAYCFHKTTRKVAKAEHLLQSNGNVVKKPTCTVAGVGNGICQICGDFVTVGIPAKGHTFVEYTVTKEATCTEKGEREAVCKYCNATNTEETEATGHAFNEGVIVLEPTTTNTGILEKTCTLCGEKKQEKVPQLTQNKEETENEEGTVEEEKPGKVDYTLYIIIGGSALLLIVILLVIILIVSGSKKKKAKKNKKEETAKTEIVS